MDRAKLLLLLLLAHLAVLVTAARAEGSGDGRRETASQVLARARTRRNNAAARRWRGGDHARWSYDRELDGKDSEEVYMMKASRDALIGKGADRKRPNFDSINLKALNGGEHEEEKRSANGYRARKQDLSQREGVVVDDAAAAAATRPKKLKKQQQHGGFIPLPGPKERKPNIILILTDDQDVELGSLNFMPRTLRLLRDGGAEFRHAYVTTPMCCPSRSSLLTGMYVHNHNVFTNNENCSNVQWQQTHETRTFATYLSNAGYRTGYFGKYLNKYNGSYIPPGWREWGGLIMNSRYYNYSINMNGKKIKHGWDYGKDYYTDLIANDSVAFLRQSKQFSRKPVMLVVSFPAPHGPEDSAPQFQDMFLNVTTHHTPSYDFAPNPDKQWILQVTKKMQNIHKQFTDMLMTKRLQTLQSVDVAVERIYQELKNIGELENTYIIYTSDHGYHLGQFGLVKGKSFPFEFDVRVPFLVRGPGVEPGTLVEDIVLNIDLAPTFLDLAGVEPPPHMDGRSIARLLHNRQSKRRKVKWPDTFLIESPGRRENPADLSPEGKRARQHKNRYKNLFGFGKATTAAAASDDASTDLAELDATTEGRTYGGESLESDADDDEEEDAYEDNSSTFRDIAALGNAEGLQVDNKILNQAYVPKSARLAMECRRPDMQHPCQPGQKWHCVAEGGRWRKHKCKFQRNCICSTPKGFLYAKLENYDRRAHKHFYGKTDKQYFRTRREAVDYDAFLSSILGRRKRETGAADAEAEEEEDISAIVDDLEQELSEAEETEMALNTTVVLGEEPALSRCSVTALGRVNCSNLVYSDFATWKRSRDEIEAKIKSLKMELEALKEIRKHLRERRPEARAAYNNATDGSSSSSSSVEVDDVRFNETEFDAFTTEDALFNVSVTETTEPDTTTTTTTTTTTMATTTTTTVGHKWRNSRNRSREDAFSNRIDGAQHVDLNRGKDKCVCALEGHDLLQKNEAKELAKEARRRMKEERLRKKERKLRKKGKMEKECLSEKMNCFNHDNEHWRTPPLWTEGPFCFCMNANNNSYSCLRTINSTHNFLYCEFTTGLRTFYNLRLDPFEQLNRMVTLTAEESTHLSRQLAELKGCKGARQCSLGSAAGGREASPPPPPISLPRHREMIY